MSDLIITIIQTHLHWHDPQANRQMFDDYLDKIKEPTDLIILPEMFTTGFTMEPEMCAEAMKGPTFQWMKDTANENDAVICGSLVVEHNQHYYNRLIWMYPDGTYGYYDKRHLFRMANEHEKYTAGQTLRIFEYRGWRICPLVCYDLRFPVWSRSKDNYDLAIFVANWPAPRIGAWDTLLKARAIENVAYIAGVNRIGEDANGIAYVGHSAILNFLGDPLVEAGENAVVTTHALERDALFRFRDKFPVQLDADEFSIKNS